ncbi:hypothetical protein [Scytonema sp. NUACC21]
MARSSKLLLTANHTSALLCEFTISGDRALLAIEPGNEIALATLVAIAENNDNDWLRRYAAEVLIPSRNNYCEKALNTIVDLAHLENSPAFNHLLVSSQIIDHKNKIAKEFLDQFIGAKVKLIQTFEEVEDNKESLQPCHRFSYELALLKEVDNLLPILQNEHLPQVLTNLKDQEISSELCWISIRKLFIFLVMGQEMRV